MGTRLPDVTLAKDSVEPIYQQIARHFRAQIESGRLAPGDRLPPTRDMARQLGIGRSSVVSAYAQLQAEGLIAAHAGGGTYVSGARALVRGLDLSLIHISATTRLLSRS